MNRAVVLAAALIVSAATLVATRAGAQALEATASGDWVAGTNYLVLKTPIPTNVAKGKVEVIEFFWYGCGHCNALDPTLESWKASKPAYVEFSRIHVVWGPIQQQHAKLF